MPKCVRFRCRSQNYSNQNSGYNSLPQVGVTLLREERTIATGYPIAKDREGNFLKSTLSNIWDEDIENWPLMRTVRTLIPNSTAGKPRWKVVIVQDISADSYKVSSAWMQWIVKIEARVLDKQGQRRPLIVLVVVPTALFLVNKLLQVGHRFSESFGCVISYISKNLNTDRQERLEVWVRTYYRTAFFMTDHNLSTGLQERSACLLC